MEQRIEFRDNLEVYEYIKDTPPGNYSRRYEDTIFCEYSWEETVDALLHGWPDGVKSITEISDRLDARLDEELRSYSIQYDVTGDCIDMGRFVVGEPECCGTVIAGPVVRPVVNIAVNISALSSVHQNYINRRGAAILSLINNMRRDHIVQVHIFHRATDVSVPIDSTTGGREDALEIYGMSTTNDFSRDLLAFYLAHPGMLRRISFSVNERQFGRPHLGGYGRPDKEFRLPFPPGEKAIHFEALMSNSGDFRDTASSVARVVSEIERLRKKE